MQPQTTTHPAERLLGGQPPPLAGWYGEPLTAAAAAQLCERLQEELQSRLRRNRGVFPLHVLQLVCDFWQRADGTPGCARPAPAGNRQEQALLELVQGQLLMSRKLRPATDHLARGFRLAAPWLASADYFTLLGRHERLAGLPLTGRPAPAQGLRTLLAEAAVIRRMRGGSGSRGVNRQSDTVG